MMDIQQIDDFHIQIELARLELKVHNLKFLTEESRLYLDEHLEPFFCVKHQIEECISLLEKVSHHCVKFGPEGRKTTEYLSKLKYFKAELGVASVQFESSLRLASDKQLGRVMKNESVRQWVRNHQNQEGNWKLSAIEKLLFNRLTGSKKIESEEKYSEWSVVYG